MMTIMLKRITAFVLAFALVFTSLPASVFAEETETTVTTEAQSNSNNTTDQKAQEAAEKAAQEKAAAEKAAQEKAAAEKAAQEKEAAEKAAQEKAAQEAAEQAAREKAAQEEAEIPEAQSSGGTDQSADQQTSAQEDIRLQTETGNQGQDVEKQGNDIDNADDAHCEKTVRFVSDGGAYITINDNTLTEDRYTVETEPFFYKVLPYEGYDVVSVTVDGVNAEHAHDENGNIIETEYIIPAIEDDSVTVSVVTAKTVEDELTAAEDYESETGSVPEIESESATETETDAETETEKNAETDAETVKEKDDSPIVLPAFNKNSVRSKKGMTDPLRSQSSSSSDLMDFMTNVSIQAPTNEQGVYIVEPGEGYSINMSFKERPDLQYDNASMTYPIPEGLEADGHSGSFSVNIERDGQIYTITGNSYSIENSVLTVAWNQSDPNYSHLTASANVRFSLSFDGVFDADTNRIIFSDSIVKNLEVDTSNSVTVSKSAQADVAGDKIYYTATVTSSGKSQNVVITDTISGTGLTLDPFSIRASSSTGQPVAMTGSVSGNSFTYTVPEMKNGEIITFRYAADIDPSVLQMIDGKVITQSDNTFKATSDGDPEGDQKHVSNTIDYTPKVTKSGGVVTGTDGTIQTLTWKLTVNPDAKVSAAGTRVTDAIGAGSQGIMKYSGNGIVVTVTDANGTIIRTDDAAWSAMESRTDSAWTYVIPQDDAGHAYKYEISYTTEVETKDLVKLTNVDNTVTTNGGGSSSGRGQVGPADGEVELQKQVTDVDKVNKEVTWAVTLAVPARGLNEAVVTDTYPSRWINGRNIYEKVKEGTVTVTGLTEGEDWSVAYGDINAVITFTKDGQPGLKGTGSARTVTVTLKTEISDEWVEASKEQGYLIAHENKVDLNSGLITASATADITAKQVKKNSTAASTRTVDGVELPVYKYEVELFGVETDSFTITDTFDTEILEPYNGGDDAFYIYGGTQWWQGNKGANPVSYINTTDGMTISVSMDSLPKDGNKYYTGYKLVYYLTVKNQAALSKLIARAAASPDGKATLTNKADWEGRTDTAPVVYTYSGLDKEILTSDEDLKKTDQDIYADFRITLNPGGLMLNEGDPLTMTDTVSNLSVVLDSIRATPGEGVTWDMTGNTVTYTIPDATRIVITYTARVILTDIGEPGDTVTVNFSNTAEMGGYRDEIDKTAERHNSGGGAGTVPNIKLLKYEAGNMTRKLSGAVFALLDAAKNPVVDKDGNEVTFTTDANGMIKVEGDQLRDGWSIIEDTRYYLRETRAPEGYKLSSFDYSFQVSSDGTTDYSQYIYHSGDIMSAKNYPGTDVTVSKIWSDGNDRRNDDDYVEVKLQQKIGNGEWSDTIRTFENEEWTDKDLDVLTLNNENGWAGKFSDLAATVPPSLPEEEDVEYVNADYRIIETKAVVNGDEIEIIDDETREDKNVSYVITKEGGTYVAVVTNNIEETGSLKISKSLSGNATDKDKEFHFTVTVEGASGSYEAEGAAGNVSFTDGIATVTLKGGEDVTIRGLPDGAEYTVTETEANQDDYVTSSVGASGMIDSTKTGDATPEAAFTNTRNKGGLTITKTFAGNTDKLKEEDKNKISFTVTGP